jgi:hypothetical protein
MMKLLFKMSGLFYWLLGLYLLHRAGLSVTAIGGVTLTAYGYIVDHKLNGHN